LEKGTEVRLNIIDTLGLRSRDNWKDDGKQSESVIVFGSLYGEHLFEGKFWRYNHAIAMNLKTVWARWLYRKFLTFAGASWDEQYDILASTIRAQSGIKDRSQLRDTHKEIDDAFKELEQNSVLRLKDIVSVKKGRKIVDKKYSWYFTTTFCSDLKIMNARLRDQKQSIVAGKPTGVLAKFNGQ